MIQKRIPRTIITLIVFFSLLVQISIIFHEPQISVHAEPEVRDNGDFTATSIWNFSDPSVYDLNNTIIQNNAVNLSLTTLYWNQSSKIDFDSGIHTYTNSTPAGDVILGEEMKNVNIIENGDFSSDQDWQYEPSSYIISTHNGSSLSAELKYSYSTGANIVYLIPQVDEDDGQISYWLSFDAYSMENSSVLGDIGFVDDGNLKSRRAYFYFDLGVIPVTAIIDNVDFYCKLMTPSTDIDHRFDIHPLDVPRPGSSAKSIYLSSGNGTAYIDDSTVFSQGQPPVYYELNLGAQAQQDVENNLSRGWFGIGLHEEGDNNERARVSTKDSGADLPQLNVSFTSTAPVTFDEIAYVNQTFYKPNVTPNDPLAATLSFDYMIEKFIGTSADLIIEIDGTPIWGPYPIPGTTSWTNVDVDIGQFLTAAGNYNISLQLHMDVNGVTNVQFLAKYDNVKITTYGYEWSGNYLSQEFSPSTYVFWDEISWNFSTDSETDLTIRTRNSPDGSSWDLWSYEYSNKHGDQIQSSPGKKIQFSANLTTSDYVKTPYLSDVNISYKKFHSSGTIEMNSDYVPSNLRNWGTLYWTDSDNGQLLTYWYSIDSGNTWNQTLDGNLTGVSILTGKIRFKTEFTTTNGIITPTLFEWNLTHEISELPTIFGFVSPGVGLIDTYFNFSVRYSDPEGDPPVNLTLNITSGTSHQGVWDVIESNATDTNYTDGKWYHLNITNFLRGSNYSFHFAAKDPSGIWSIGPDINGPYVLNSPPKIITENRLGAQGGILYYNDYEAHDLEDEANLTWSVLTNASWLYINPLDGNLSGTPPSGDKGYYWINIEVNDGHGGLDDTNFTITVGDTQPPVADAGKDQIVYEDDLVFFNGTKSTDNIEIINYTWDFGDTLGYGSTSSHIFKQKGTYVVALTVFDVIQNYDIDYVRINVLNKPPLADAGINRIVNEGEEVNFNASASHDTPTDNGSLIFLWDFDGDLDFNDGVGINVSYTWFKPQNAEAKLRVIDNDGDLGETSVSVIVNNIPPSVDIAESYNGEKGSEIIIVASYYDPGDTEVQFRWDWENDGIWDTNRSSEFIVYHTWDEEGEYTLVVEAWDGTESVTDNALVEITRYNIPPKLGDLGIRKIRYNSPFTMDLAQFITDDDNLLSDMIVTTDDHEHISINGVEITLIYPEDLVGQTIEVLVTVSDGIAQDNSILIVQITQNYPPTLKKSFPDVTFNEDGTAQNIFNLNDYFEDLDGDNLDFGFISIEPSLIVNIASNGYVSFSTIPNWAGSTIVRFQAEDPSGALTDERVFISVLSINDAPIVLRQIQSSFTTIGEEGNWTIDLDDYFFDVDNFNLTFTSNYPEIKIDPLTHEALWIPGVKKKLNDVRFTASDGEHSVSLDPVDLTVVEQNPIPWFLIIPLIIAFIIIFIVYRELQYRYMVEEVFLVDNAGVLLVHISQWESKAIDAKLVSGMLTAVQEFVKDSFRAGNGGPKINLADGALGKLEYGDFQIVLERGTYTFLSAVISGNDNKRLRKRMKDVVDDFESKYSSVLANWDGDMAQFDGAERIVGRLLKNHPGMKIATESKMKEPDMEHSESEVIEDSPELPHGDFGDVPSYYDETDGGDYYDDESN